jgi:pyruvate formate lyase activating enzyme
MESERGRVFDIQRFSLHDGSGIRTLVFLKGCPLRCTWCSNPEGQSCAPQLAYHANRCIGRAECGDACRTVCEFDAIRAAAEQKVSIALDRCTACGRCVEVCPSRALRMLGELMSVEDVLRIVEEDSPFYARSGGGLTLSGGEPLLQAGFAERLLETARARGLDTAIETSGCAPWHELERVCHHVDEVFYDVKCLDAARHRRGTGIGNERILENLRRLCEVFPTLRVTVRTPVIPGFNDAPEAIRAVVDFLNELPGSLCYELLPYHRFGEPKYTELGLAYPLPGVEPPSAARMADLNRIVAEAWHPRRAPGAP